MADRHANCCVPIMRGYHIVYLVWCKRLVGKQHYFEKLIPEAVLVVFPAL